MWDLLPQLGIRSRPPVLGAKSLSHWTTRAVPSVIIFNKKKYFNPMVKKTKQKKNKKKTPHKHNRTVTL